MPAPSAGFQDGFLDKSDLNTAIERLLSRWRECQISTNLSMRVEEVTDPYSAEGKDNYLTISRPLKSRAPSSRVSESKPPSSLRLGGEELIELHEDCNDDDETSIHHDPLPPTAIVEYNIIFSTTYRVPVLYFYMHNLPPSTTRGLEAVYEYLVPGHQKQSLREVGVLGGVSMTNHPITDVPCFWVHPCNTAEAMAELVGGRERHVSGLEYLMLWIGLVGSAVGLNLPKEVGLFS